MKGAARRVALEVVGWGLVLLGIAALVLPGPGLLLLFAGIFVLSQQYEWAERRLDPIKYRALKGAAESVETYPRLVASTLGALGLFGFAALWLADPDVPGWWPLSDGLWLPGGSATAITLAVSGVMALALLVYSFRRFHGKPEAVAEFEQEIDEADAEFHRD